MTTLSRTTNDTFFIDNLDVRITESVSISNWVLFGFLCSWYFLLCCFNFFVIEITKNNKQNIFLFQKESKELKTKKRNKVIKPNKKLHLPRFVINFRIEKGWARNRIWCFYLGLQRWDVSMYNYVSSLHLSPHPHVIYMCIYIYIYMVKCFSYPLLLTSKPKTMKQSAQTTIPINHYKALYIFKYIQNLYVYRS